MMENKQTFKRIVSFSFALLVAFVFCLSVFPVKSFADSYIYAQFNIIFNGGLSAHISIFDMTDNSRVLFSSYLSVSSTFTLNIPSLHNIRLRALAPNSSVYYIVSTDDFNFSYGTTDYPITNIYSSANNRATFTLNVDSSASDYTSRFNFQFVATSSPTPAPATPTPEPTPTAEPTPTPEPTFNPNYPTFDGVFNKFKDDANNAFSALYVTWTTISGKFYSNLFIIALPIGLLLFSIVLGLFFGDD